MAAPSRGPTSFWTQTGALFRKNLIIEKRNIGRIIWILFQGILWSSVLLASQIAYDKMTAAPHCDYQRREYQGSGCPDPSPPTEWPPLLQLPDPKNAAVNSDIFQFKDLPDESCRKTASCPVTVLVTGNDQSMGELLLGNMFPSSPSMNLSDNVLGSSQWPDNYVYDEAPEYNVQRHCIENSTFSAVINGYNQDIKCVQGIPLWRDSSSKIDDELFRGHLKGNKEGKINEIVAAYDLLNSDRSNFHVSIWYNKSFINPSSTMLKVARSVNLISNTYLQYLQGPGTEMEFEFIKEMPKSELGGDFSQWASPIFISAIILQLFPLALKLLVNERQQKLRIMMKMHGLGDGPYWMITYTYFLFICSIYILFIVTFCSVGGLRFFKMNDYLIQFVFFFVYINLQISVSFLVATFFSDLKTVAVMTPLFIAGTAILGKFLFESYLTNPLVPRTMVLALELYPGFSLYRGLYEFGYYTSLGKSVGTVGMRWSDLSDSANGMREILVIMLVEWVIALYVGFHIDSGKNPLNFLKNIQKKPLPSNQNHLRRRGSEVLVQMEKPDVSQEREKVEQLLFEPSNNHSLISDNLKKVYPGKDGNPDNIAVKGLSLALPRAECFGMLGPNGAGKTSFISMMIGLTKPTSGTAFVQGLDLRTQMDEIYTSMGVCPQHDLLWGSLTGREHLLFYGRLKNLTGSALTRAVEESLKSVNLFYGGVADKQAKKYSGGMKRRLSVAISLIGDPKVVYMDEPSSGLDPASRNHLWNVVKKAKKDRAIFLTTHSMEEAEALCDRLGIFVDGSLQCIGNPNELKARYGGSYVFTMTTSSEHEEDVENLARHLSPSASKIYHISGTQKFELPKIEVKISNVFEAVENAKRRFTVIAWGLADTTLEDVFLKVAGQAQTNNSFS